MSVMNFLIADRLVCSGEEERYGFERLKLESFKFNLENSVRIFC